MMIALKPRRRVRLSKPLRHKFGSNAYAPQYGDVDLRARSTSDITLNVWIHSTIFCSVIPAF